jgi:uncharacterized protein DUF4352
VYSSKDLRTPRYQFQSQTEARRIKPGWFILGGLAIVLILCCCVGSLGLVWQQGWLSRLPLTSFGSRPTASSSGSTTKTPTPNPDVPVPLRTRAVAESGLEITVVSFQRPLTVQGFKGGPPDQQFALVTLRIRNTKSTGAPIPVTPTDFTAMGDGGIAYVANPKNVTIQNLLTATTLGVGKEITAELIFQIATNDSGMRLNWNTGGSNRIFLLEESK